MGKAKGMQQICRAVLALCFGCSCELPRRLAPASLPWSTPYCRHQRWEDPDILARAVYAQLDHGTGSL